MGDYIFIIILNSYMKVVYSNSNTNISFSFIYFNQTEAWLTNQSSEESPPNSYAEITRNQIVLRFVENVFFISISFAYNTKQE